MDNADDEEDGVTYITDVVGASLEVGVVGGEGVVGVAITGVDGEEFEGGKLLKCGGGTMHATAEL